MRERGRNWIRGCKSKRARDVDKREGSVWIEREELPRGNVRTSNSERRPGEWRGGAVKMIMRVDVEEAWPWQKKRKKKVDAVPGLTIFLTKVAFTLIYTTTHCIAPPL